MGENMGLDALRYWFRQDHVFIYDSSVTRSHRQLRALPAMAYLGYKVFTYPKSWSQLAGTETYSLFEHSHTHINDMNVLDAPTCVITNQNYEEHTPNTIAALRNIPRAEEGRLAICADQRKFQIQGAKRPLRDQHNVITRSYEEVYDTFEEHYAEEGYTMPLSDTRNLFLQDNAILYQEVSESTVNGSVELLEVVSEAPYLPLYGSLCRIFNRDESFGSSPLTADEVGEFVKWLRCRVEWDNKTAERITEMLNKQVLEDSNVFAHATRIDHTTTTEVRETKSGLENRSHSLERRMYRWLEDVGR
jgi:hypothetical protein